MTEINTEPQVSGVQEKTEASPVKNKSGKGAGRSILLAVLLLVIVLLGAAFWYQQQQFQQVRQQMTRQLEQGAAVARQADERAQQALAAMKRQESRVSELKNTVDAADSHLQSLEQALQIATDSGSDLMLLNDIDRLLVIAQQQLQLSSNVGNAIIALESAQSQLARANRPSFASVQQALNGDLDRLRGVANVDFALRTSQLDALYGLISDAPMLVDSPQASGGAEEIAQAAQPRNTPEAPTEPAAPTDESWWKTSLDVAQRWSMEAWQSVKHDLNSLIEVRRVDDHAALLMSLDQSERLRDSMRLRVVTARLALLMRQPDVWKSELAMLEKMLSTRFDGNSAQVRRAISLVNTLAETPVAADLPTLENSVRAIEAQREVVATSSSNGTTPPVANAAKDEEDKKDIEFPNLVGHTPDENGGDRPGAGEAQGAGSNGGSAETPAGQPQAAPAAQDTPPANNEGQTVSHREASGMVVADRLRASASARS